MRISDIMTKDVKTVPPTWTVNEAADLMRRKHIRHLVVTKKSQVLGVVSDGDVRLPSFFAEPLTEVMTVPAITIGPNDTVRTAASRISSRGVSSLPVVDHGELVGIVTVADLLRVLARGVEAAPRSRAARRYRTPRHAHRAQPAARASDS
jgi:CBS domain-containing protein